MHTLDRMLFFAYIRSYVIVLTSLISLYVVIDLFTNIDDFAGRGNIHSMVRHIASYYGPQIALIFDRMCEAIALLAAVFTMSWAVRNNELLPQLSAGISAHRVIRPILIGSVLALSIGPISQELLIPRIADELQIPKDDPNLERPIELKGAFDSTGVHLEGIAGYRKDQRIKAFFVTFPESATSAMSHLQVEEAIYFPRTDAMEAGWMLFNATPEIATDALPEQLQIVGPRRYFLRTRDTDFDAMTRGSKWYMFASTRKLQEILSRPDPRRMAPVAVMFHMRFTRPIIGMLMVVLGLSMLLRNHNRHVLVSAGVCLVMSASVYALVFACRYLGEADILAAPLAAWAPVILFGAYSLAQFDAIQT